MIRIVVGSTSILKVRAVELAIERVGVDAKVIGVDADSGVPPQPYGREQTVEGAINRARAALKACAEGDYAVGIENGLVPSGPDVVDVAYVVVFVPSGHRLVRRSVGVPAPPEIVEAALAAKQSRTAGALEAARSGSDPADPHRVWSKGTTDRETVLVNVLYSALLSATVHEEGVRP